MRIIGLLPARNEAWVLGLTLRAALLWCDDVLVLDHCSTDETSSIVMDIKNEYPGRVHLLCEPDPLWAEMAHRQRLLASARAAKATHIALIDADELLTENALMDIRDIANALADGQIYETPWLCLKHVDPLESDSKMMLYPWGSYYSSGVWARQYASLLFRDAPHYHWAARNGYDFHHRQPMGCSLAPVMDSLNRERGLMHLQFLSKRRLFAKQYLYQLIERLRWPDREPLGRMVARYSSTVNEAMSANVCTSPEAWWKGYEPLLQYLDLAAEPWQEAECRLILKENPGIEKGLNNFGMEL